MCWNPDISINTFVFSCFALLFIYFSNTFTKYKILMFTNPLFYLLFLEIASMQLIEFFLWRNLKDKYINYVLSRIASWLIILQQFTLLCIIPNETIKYSMFLLYALFLMLYKYFHSVNAYTTIGKNGHLAWEWANYKGYEYLWLISWLFFYIVPILFINNFLLSIFTIPILLLSLFYYEYKTFGTVWCWVINFCLLYFVLNILLIKPYFEYNGLC